MKYVPRKGFAMAAKAKSVIMVMGGKVTLEDGSPKAWANYLRIFEVLTKATKSKATVLRFEAPDIRRGLLDAVPEDYLAKKYKLHISEGSTEAPLNIARQILAMAKGFDIAVRFDAIEMIFFHTGKLEILAELRVAAKLAELLKKMFPKARIK